MLTAQIHPSIHRIATPYEGGGTVFLYLVRGGEIALIDTGAASSPSSVLQPALAELGISLSDVDVILNTHGHLDHAGGNANTRTVAPSAKIYMHPSDVPIATDLDYEIEFHIAPLRALDFPEGFIRNRRDYIAVAAGIPKVPVDATLAGGDTVDLGRGIKLKAVHAPGHTPGHLVFYWESERVLFAGDAVQGQGSRPGGFPYYFDAVAYRRSLATIAELGVDTLCMSHGYIGGGPISDATRRGDDVREILRESTRVADAIQSAVAKALERNPARSRREVAVEALDDLLYEIPQVRLRDTRMPASAGPALNTHIDAVLGGGYPAVV